MTFLEIVGFINTVILLLLCLVIAVKFIGSVPVAPAIPGALFAPKHVGVGLVILVPSAIIAGLLMSVVWYFDGELSVMTGLEIFSIVYGIFIGLYALYLV